MRGFTVLCLVGSALAAPIAPSIAKKGLTLTTIESELSSVVAGTASTLEISSLESELTTLLSSSSIDAELSSLISEVLSVIGGTVSTVESDLTPVTSLLSTLEGTAGGLVEGVLGELGLRKRSIDVTTLTSELQSIIAGTASTDVVSTVESELTTLLSTTGITTELSSLVSEVLSLLSNLSSESGDLAPVVTLVDTLLYPVGGILSGVEGVLSGLGLRKRQVDLTSLTSELESIVAGTADSSVISSVEAELASLLDLTSTDAELTSLISEVQSILSSEISSIESDLTPITALLDSLLSPASSILGELGLRTRQVDVSSVVSLVQSELTALLAGDSTETTIEQVETGLESLLTVDGLSSDLTFAISQVESLLKQGYLAVEGGAVEVTSLIAELELLVLKA